MGAESLRVQNERVADAARKRSFRSRRDKRTTEVTVMFTHRAGFGIAVIVLVAGGASGQVTRRVSVDSAGNQGNNGSYLSLTAHTLSANGRWVVFDSFATNLVSG